MNKFIWRPTLYGPVECFKNKIERALAPYSILFLMILFEISRPLIIWGLNWGLLINCVFVRCLFVMFQVQVCIIYTPEAGPIAYENVAVLWNGFGRGYMVREDWTKNVEMKSEWKFMKIEIEDSNDSNKIVNVFQSELRFYKFKESI